jgi:hypothetical protein
MSKTHTNAEEEFRVDIGRADKGQTFVRVVHIPSGKERIQVGLEGNDARDVAKRLTEELRTELGL